MDLEKEVRPKMVGAIGVEPTTPTVSRWCSATELRANKIGCDVDEEAYNSLRNLSQQRLRKTSLIFIPI